jgi:hypothetical protein
LNSIENSQNRWINFENQNDFPNSNINFWIQRININIQIKISNFKLKNSTKKDEEVENIKSDTLPSSLMDSNVSPN